MGGPSASEPQRRTDATYAAGDSQGVPYTELGALEGEEAITTAASIPGARLIRLDGLGHAPQVEAPDRFQKTLLNVLASVGH